MPYGRAQASVGVNACFGWSPRTLVAKLNNVVVAPLFLFCGDLYFEFSRFKLVMACVVSDLAAVKALFKRLRFALDEFGSASVLAQI